MKGCSENRETLWLDILGELSLRDGRGLQRHLESCPECRKERESLSVFLKKTAAVMPEGTLSAADSSRMNRDILRKLQEKNPSAHRLKPRRFVPALAAFLLLVVTGLWFSFQAPDAGNYADRSAGAEDEMILNDIEIIRNLDFLKELDSLRKLVRLVDDYDSEVPEMRPTEGSRSSERGEANA